MAASEGCNLNSGKKRFPFIILIASVQWLNISNISEPSGLQNNPQTRTLSVLEHPGQTGALKGLVGLSVSLFPPCVVSQASSAASSCKSLFVCVHTHTHTQTTVEPARVLNVELVLLSITLVTAREETTRSGSDKSRRL